MSRYKKRILAMHLYRYVIGIILLSVIHSFAHAQHQINLSKIGHLSSKGRAQDIQYNQSDEIEKLIEMGKGAIPFLIDRIPSAAAY